MFGLNGSIKALNNAGLAAAALHTSRCLFIAVIVHRISSHGLMMCTANEYLPGTLQRHFDCAHMKAFHFTGSVTLIVIHIFAASLSDIKSHCLPVYLIRKRSSTLNNEVPFWSPELLSLMAGVSHAYPDKYSVAVR